MMKSDMPLYRPHSDEVLPFMGVSPTSDVDTLRNLIDACGEELLGVVNPRWCATLCDITFEPGGVRLDSGLLLEGRDIAAHLEGCSRVAVFAATLGAEVDALIHRTQYTDMARALALDCTAGALIEQVCNEVERALHARLHNLHSPYRYSPGYGDLPLAVQPELLDLVDAHRAIGLSATDSLIMTPRKSVTAILGLSDTPIPTHKRSCPLCPNADNCQLRKAGGHCGL